MKQTAFGAQTYSIFLNSSSACMKRSWVYLVTAHLRKQVLRSSFPPHFNIQGPSWCIQLQADPQLVLSPSTVQSMHSVIFPKTATKENTMYSRHLTLLMLWRKEATWLLFKLFQRKLLSGCCNWRQFIPQQNCCSLLPIIWGWAGQQWWPETTEGSRPYSVTSFHWCPIGTVEMPHCNSAALWLALPSHLRSKLAQLPSEISLLSMAIVKVTKNTVKHWTGTNRNMPCNPDCNRKLIAGSLEVYMP